MESGYEGVLCCTGLVCLGRGQVLHRVNVLKSEIELVLEMTGISFIRFVITSGCAALRVAVTSLNTGN
jgi:hypothetical protein